MTPTRSRALIHRASERIARRIPPHITPHIAPHPRPLATYLVGSALALTTPIALYAGVVTIRLAHAERAVPGTAAWRLLAELGPLALGLALLGALGAFAINRAVAGAVADLARLAEAVGRGEPAGAVPRVRVREFATIAVTLRRGGRALRTRDEALERARRELEARVEERTRALAEQGRRLAATLDAMDQGLFMIDADGRVPVANRRAAELLDLDPAFLARAPHFTEIRGLLIARGEYGGVDAGFRRWLEAGDLEADAAYERVRPNGTVLEVRSTDMPGGGFVRTYTDVTARRRAEIALGEQTALLNATFENMAQGLMMIDGAGTVRFCNERATQLLDLPPALMRAQPSFEDVRRHQLARDEFARSGEGVRAWVEASGLELSMHAYERERPDGTVLEVRTVPLPAGGAVRTYTDITERKRAEARVLASEARLRALADALPQMVWVMRADDGEATYRNARFDAYYGAIGNARHERAARNHPDDAERVERFLTQARGRGEICQAEVRVLRRDGAYRWHRFALTPTREADGTIVEWLGTALDIDDIVKARDALARTGDLLRLAKEAAGAGIWDWDARRRVMRLSRESLAMQGFAQREGADGAGEDGVEMTLPEWAARIHPEDVATVRAELRAAMTGGRTFAAEFRAAHPGEAGGWRWIQAFGRLVHDAGSERVTRVVGLTLEITARKEAERRVAHVARHDSLTDLPNRLLFRERLDQVLAAARRVEGRAVHHGCAVLCLDLDRFKAVNDTLGHPAGDRLLAEVARRLRAALRTEDTVARLGGDEFAIIQSAPGDVQPRGAAALASRLIEAVSQPILIDGRPVAVGLSVGIALAAAGERDGDAVFKRADMALYRAKAEGRSTYRFYEAAMDEAVEARRRLELDLRGALQRAEFELHYQPIVAVADGRLTGFEALVRWRHPERGLISPAEFIPLAEETGLIVPIGGWVLRTALREARSWPGDLRVAVNVSAAQVRGAGFLPGLVAALAASGLPAGRLELEITETVLMGDGAEVLALLEGVRRLGARIALDDFGTGYSSLSYLRRFPFDKIKIDRSFIEAIANADTAAIVRAIVGLGARLGMSITAEGVETPAQLALLRAEGCTEAQGYLFSRPLTAAQTAARLASPGAALADALPGAAA